MLLPVLLLEQDAESGEVRVAVGGPLPRLVLAVSARAYCRRYLRGGYRVAHRFAGRNDVLFAYGVVRTIENDRPDLHLEGFILQRSGCAD
jgi:hypothetical protein